MRGEGVEYWEPQMIFIDHLFFPIPSKTTQIYKCYYFVYWLFKNNKDYFVVTNMADNGLNL